MTGHGGHPAVAAWHSLEPGAPAPTAVVTLKDVEKCSVFRLDGVGASIIAKRTRRHLARNEHAFYTSVLPQLGLASLQCHGLVDRGPRACWVFLEYCAGSAFRPLEHEHRRIAADWLGTLHLRGRERPSGLALRDRRLLTYRAHLGSTRRQLLDAQAAGPLRHADHALIDRVLVGLDALDAAWGVIEEICEPLPASVVHTDAKRSNFMVRPARDSTLEFIPFDWAEAGWGVPVVDLPYVDGRVYWQTLGVAWDHAVVTRHRRMRTLGVLLRWLVAIDKVCMGLPDVSYTAQAMDQLRWFLLRVTPALRVLDEQAEGVPPRRLASV